MSSQRTKYCAPPSSIEEGVKLARSLYSNGSFLKALDVYEQLLDRLDTWAAPDSDIIIAILAEVYDCLKPYWQQDRYTLYQSRFFDFDIKENDTVLDIGSGDRPFPFATHLADISLLDGNVGRAGMPIKYVAGKPLYECSIENLPFSDNEFDFVYCSHVLEHVSAPEKACSELMRIARRGFIETPNTGKDLWLNYAKISNHRWGVNLVNGVLQFSEYSERETAGFNCNIVNEMHEHPETRREKALSALVILKADLINNMLLWEGTFDFEVIRRKGESPVSLNTKSCAEPARQLVSVIIPTFNRASLLERAVTSVQKQSPLVFEIIIVDDNSSDQTEQVVERLAAGDSRIQYIRHEHNRGAQAARNTGIEAASGGWIAFLDSDDEWLPGKLEKQLELAKETGVAVIHSECYVVREGCVTELLGIPPYSGNIYAALLANPGPMFQGMLIKRKALFDIGLLDENVPSFQEWDTAIRLAEHNSFGFVPEPLFVYHCHGGETISKDMKRHAKGYVYIVEKYAIDILNVAGTEVLAKHYHTIITHALEHNLQEMAKLYIQKYKALNSTVR